MDSVIVFGGNGLIGSEVVTELLNSGYFVLSVDLTPSTINNEKLHSIQFDVSKVDKIKEFIDSVGKDFSPTYLVNASFPRGKGWKRDPHNIDSDEFSDNIKVHLDSYCLITYYFAQHLQKLKKKGSIVNVASIFGVISPPIHLYDFEENFPSIPYPAIKGGIISFSVFAAGKFGQDQIRINCVSPGVVQGSKMQGANDFIEGMKKNMLGRTGLPQEIAKPVKFLLSEDASFMTGQNLIIDGGWTNI